MIEYKRANFWSGVQCLFKEEHCLGSHQTNATKFPSVHLLFSLVDTPLQGYSEFHSRILKSWVPSRAGWGVWVPCCFWTPQMLPCKHSLILLLVLQVKKNIGKKSINILDLWKSCLIHGFSIRDETCVWNFSSLGPFMTDIRLHNHPCSNGCWQVKPAKIIRSWPVVWKVPLFKCEATPQRSVLCLVFFLTIFCFCLFIFKSPVLGTGGGEKHKNI